MLRWVNIINKKVDEKRVFFALEVKAPWPEKLPKGRVLDPHTRHATLAFVGEISLSDLFQHAFPRPSFKVGLVGVFNECLFLPFHHPNVVAWKFDWYDETKELREYRQKLLNWLNMHHYPLRDNPKDWLYHVTLSRKPFEKKEWQAAFKPLPMLTQSLHLYASLGHLDYQPLWSHSFIPPFQEIKHPSKTVYLINAENFNQIYQHAFAALAFYHPPLTSYYHTKNYSHLKEIIADLNFLIAQVKADQDCPLNTLHVYKDIQIKESIFQFEMIIDK
ncbi:Uncharacterized protein NEOC65_000490 [Neochlamydia sp. AcF65]|nr:Uncharacterized protein [Neochlamydia sp. AcF65]